MAKTNVSEWDIVADNNIRINGINIDENCPPSAINNAIREMMSQIKKWKDGYTDPLSGLDIYQSLTVQNIDVKGIIKLNGSAGTDGQVLMSKGASASPVWQNAFVRGMIMLWTGSVAPSGWALCNGGNGTPDLRDKFVMGAGGSKATTGGYSDTTLPAHTHTGTTDNGGANTVSSPVTLSGSTSSAGAKTLTPSVTVNGTTNTTGNHSHTLPHHLVQAVAGTGDIDRDNEYQQWKALSGQSTRTSGNHSHTVTSTGSVTVSIPNHTHSISGSGTASVSIPNHTHTFTTNNSGSSTTNRNLPPYYALAYIMKL